MTGLSKRDRLLLTGLPGAMLLLIYGIFFARSGFNELKELKRQSGVLSQQLPPQAERARVRGELIELRAKVQRLRSEQSQANSPGSAAPPPAESTTRADALFEMLLEQHRVILMSEALAAPNETRAYQQIISHSPGTTLWNVELAGFYPDVAEFIVALGETDLPLTPVAVAMDANRQTQSDLRRWNLWIYR